MAFAERARVRLTPTAPVAAGSLIAGYAVASASGSRPLGGVVLLAGGLWCVRAWAQRNDTRTAVTLACTGLAAFVLSHVLALAIGAWPAVLLAAAAMAAAAWLRADARVVLVRP
ncbi:MAG TPA: hypothetical protein VGI27_10850 [Solirubrobacteraceae bacterium]|jgi:hypothetical protein